MTSGRAIHSGPLDTSRLSDRGRRALLGRQCPELPLLLEQFRRRWTELSRQLEPVCRLAERGRLAGGRGGGPLCGRPPPAAAPLLPQHQPLPDGADRPPADCHPVLRRVAQYGRLLETLAPADRLRQLATLEPGPVPKPAPGPGPAPTRPLPAAAATGSEVDR